MVRTRNLKIFLLKWTPSLTEICLSLFRYSFTSFLKHVNERKFSREKKERAGEKMSAVKCWSFIGFQFGGGGGFKKPSLSFPFWLGLGDNSFKKWDWKSLGVKNSNCECHQMLIQKWKKLLIYHRFHFTLSSNLLNLASVTFLWFLNRRIFHRDHHSSFRRR